MMPGEVPQPALAYKGSSIMRDPWSSAQSTLGDRYGNMGFGNGFYAAPSSGSANYPSNAHDQSSAIPRSIGSYISRVDSCNLSSVSSNHASRFAPAGSSPVFTATYKCPNQTTTPTARISTATWDDRYSPTGSLEDIVSPLGCSDFPVENAMGISSPAQKARASVKRASQRRPSNRDEFDGPHQFLQRPSQDVIEMQERELPHLPTNLHVQEQDIVLKEVNDRLSQCAFDFVAKYQFPIPLTQDTRPVERPQDREWTEWVYLLKRLATKRRIPARVLYNGQIKQFVTVLENSLEMRYTAKHPNRPLKDDRNILQLISAGIQVAKILKDASAMTHLDRLYVDTETRIRERTMSRFRP